MFEHHGASLMYDEGRDFMVTKCEVERVSYSKIQVVVISDIYLLLYIKLKCYLSVRDPTNSQTVAPIDPKFVSY